MTNRSLNLDEPLYQYLLDVSLRESALLRQLREETAKLPVARWQIAPEQGQFMALLVKLTGAKRMLEIGTFTGYSSLCLAGAMADDGLLICCDISAEYSNIARRYWRQAGLEERIELRLGPALETMATLARSAHAESFDLIFIDADKANYPAYLEHALV
ncbi:MAG: O-methyltransferase, partial [Pseudomonas sp.]|nr:O-methyltransferase [Pseudomonas sp.]